MFQNSLSKYFLPFVLTLPSSTFASLSSLDLLFQFPSDCVTPESIFVSPSPHSLFVSCTEKQNSESKNSGSLHKYNFSGKLLKKDFLNGLTLPHGAASFLGKLYLADLNELKIVNEKSGKVERKIQFPSAKKFSDVVVDRHGTVYLSDTLGSAIFSWSKKSGAKKIASGNFLESPSGLILESNALIIAAAGPRNIDNTLLGPGKVYRYDLKSDEITLITKESLGFLESIEKFDEGRYLVNDSKTGKIWLVTKGGESQELSNGESPRQTLALIADKKILLISQPEKNLISAFQLKK